MVSMLCAACEHMGKRDADLQFRPAVEMRSHTGPPWPDPNIKRSPVPRILLAAQASAATTTSCCTTALCRPATRTTM